MEMNYNFNAFYEKKDSQPDFIALLFSKGCRWDIKCMSEPCKRLV